MASKLSNSSEGMSQFEYTSFGTKNQKLIQEYRVCLDLAKDCVIIFQLISLCILLTKPLHHLLSYTSFLTNRLTY